ncbi:hypothetical protein ACI2VH_06005 [Ralstonia nicotianae]|uniref:Uncharacterized protein n=1 Tax=Ralstonia nicotianae TaxID=3037696 RepID=A0ABX7ZY37_9RALS|nr:hypothetical protein [Ralstonia nicotianae]QUP59762.1 hypothetical protein GO999_15035 [Ralstonia nicotianae]
MATELEHPEAYYIDANGVQQKIRAEELFDVSKRALAAEHHLTDKTGQIDLHPRARDGATPHFVATGVRGTRSVFEGEKDPTHDARVETLLRKLEGARTWRLGLGNWVNRPNGQFNWEVKNPIALQFYKWGNEVYRIVTRNAIVRHDLFGQALRLDMSVNQPWVAIEVIHTHFPEEEAFAAMLEMSERVPFYVLFDFTVMEDKFVRVEPKANAIIYREWTYLIHDGHVWRGEQKQDIRTSAALRTHVLALFRKWNIKF